MTPPNCECQSAGWCERHKCFKSEKLFGLCQRDPVLFQLWEKCAGPGQFGQRARYGAAPCRSLGGLIRQIECPSCGSGIHLKVFACDIHTECTLATKNNALQGCSDCSDYQATSSTESVD